MTTVKIFLASSSELEDDRKAFALFIGRKNNELQSQGMYLDLVMWEDSFLDAMSQTRLQDEYNKAIPGCDIFVMLYWTKVGRYTNEEFEIAYKHLREENRPKILTYFKDAPISMETVSDRREDVQSLWAFQDRLRVEGREHFETRYKNFEQLALHFERQLGELGKAAAGTPPAKRVPKPHLRDPQHAIVGRQALVDKVLAGLQAGKRDFAFVYLPGIGKTTVAARLIGNEDVMKHFPDGVLWAHLGQDPDVGRELAKWARALGLSKEDIADCNGLGELAEAVIDAIGDGRMLLVVDDVWTTEAADALMLRAPNCVRIITTRYGNVARELMPTVDRVLEVPKLSADDGVRLLADEHLAPNAVRLAPRAVRQLVERVDGLPIALVLIGKMIKRDGDDEQATRATLKALYDIDRVFKEKKTLEYDEDRNLSLGDVIEASYRALGKAGALNRDTDADAGDALRSALDALSILRPDPAWFPAALARRVSGASDVALKALADAGLIERVRYESEETLDDGEPRYSMHRMIAEYIRSKLMTQPRRLQALNRLAADYYLAQLTELERTYQEGDATTYSAMYRYEDPEWQDCQDNWLYYFAQTGYDREASLSFLRAWFDGFWWWGCFTEEGYDFCDELLNDWDHRLSLAAGGDATSPVLNEKRIERLMDGLELLRRFKSAYPKETEDRGGGAWNEVTATLREIRRRTGLEGEPARLANANARHVRALTDIFLAEAQRFGQGDIAVAEDCYREAIGLFRDAKDSWNIAWSLYHLGDMLSSCGRHEDARPLGMEAIELGDAGGDHEVAALAHRLLGDVALAANAADDALGHYRSAVERAYRFQVQPRNPDPYTIQFYADVCEVVAARLLAHYAAMPEPARFIAGQLRQVWLDAGVELASQPAGPIVLEGIAVGELVARLFPPSLPVKELKAHEDAYAARVKQHLAAIDGLEASRSGASPGRD
ncbi:MAG: tetratricopeptide repeat protein [Betaproteobacteria bacterium]|nr:MAG: tetratricopeptide repeat protein [Betaproteobacteria bacterium]